MVVGAEKTQVSLGIIPRVPIDVIEMDWYPAGARVTLRPSAHLATLTALLNQVSTNVKGRYVEAGRCARDFPE